MKEMVLVETPFGALEPVPGESTPFNRTYSDAMMEMSFEVAYPATRPVLHVQIPTIEEVDGNADTPEETYRAYREGYIEGLRAAVKAHRIMMRACATPGDTEKLEVERAALLIVKKQPDISASAFAIAMDRDSQPILNKRWVTSFKKSQRGSTGEPNWQALLRPPSSRRPLEVWVTRLKKKQKEIDLAEELIAYVESLPQRKTLRREAPRTKPFKPSE